MASELLLSMALLGRFVRRNNSVIKKIKSIHSHKFLESSKQTCNQAA